MGAGIAQLGAQAGMTVKMYDLGVEYLERGMHAIRQSTQRMVDRGRLESLQRDQVLARLSAVSSISELGDCHFVIEAVTENLEVKRDVFRQLEAHCTDAAALATNTSSLSVTAIAGATQHPERVVGMHFFNPPQLMALIEIVQGSRTSESTMESASLLGRLLGKETIRVKDSPGFIVNRVARGFYLESLRMLGEGWADISTIDSVVRDAGFKLGPFQLLDLIGIDVNFSVSSLVYEQTFWEPRFRPHPIQQGLVSAGLLGRKTGRGFYDYSTDPPQPAYTRAGTGDRPIPAFWSKWNQQDALRGMITGRLLSVLINESQLMLGEGLATAADIDTAMKLGTNWPRGPFEWSTELGHQLVVETLDFLQSRYPGERYAVAPLLRS